QLQNSADAQALGRALQLRELPVGEYGALQGLSQPQFPAFPSVPGSNVSPTDISSDIYNSYAGQLNTYAGQVGAQNSTTAGLFGLGGAAIKAAAPFVLSDKEAKKNIKTVGRTPGGNRVVSFDYRREFEPFGLGGTKRKHIGVIAQEVEKKQP